jgi:hypothetical protein
MSSANASNRFPAGVVRRIAASTRFRSVRTSRNPGRYQATTRMPFAAAASRNRGTSSGCTNGRPRLKLEVCR